MKNNKPVATKPSQQGKAQIIAAEQFSGPIPPPEVFRRYGDVIPDAPERILRVFEQDSQHTRDMQKDTLKAEIARDARAQWMAFIIMLASIGLTATAAIFGNATFGILTGLATLFLALRILFIKKSNEPDKTN